MEKQVWITGDTHGGFQRFSSDNFPEQKEMTKDDYVIILGDFGGVWDDSKKENYWLDWLEEKPFTTLFIDGNHENYNLLNSYPVKEWNGGKVHFIREHVIHLMRGQLFNISGKLFFTFGGASSHDIMDGILEPNDPRIKKWRNDYNKLFRINQVSWWKEELPSKGEMNEGIRNMERAEYKVDYILTHCCYSSLLNQLDGGSGLYKPDDLTRYLQDIKQNVDYQQWLFGHFHININLYYERASCLYEQIIRLL